MALPLFRATCGRHHGIDSWVIVVDRETDVHRYAVARTLNLDSPEWLYSLGYFDSINRATTTAYLAVDADAMPWAEIRAKYSKGE